MASGLITSWQIDGETMKTVIDFIFLGSRITVSGACILVRKVMTNLGSILKNRDITLPTKVYIVKPMVFPVVMHGCESCKESWALRNCFQIVELEETLERRDQTSSPKGNQPWIFIGRSDMELKLQYFGYLMQRANSLEKTLVLGKIGNKRIKGRQRMRWLDSSTDSMAMNLRKL